MTLKKWNLKPEKRKKYGLSLDFAAETLLKIFNLNLGYVL